MEKKRIAVLFGGRSGEHEVSLNSARSVLSVLDPSRYEMERQRPEASRARSLPLRAPGRRRAESVEERVPAAAEARARSVRVKVC